MLHSCFALVPFSRLAYFDCCVRAAAAAAMLLGGGEDMHRFPVRSPRMDRGDLISSPAARQIYLTFPADSTFSEEDVSNYFRYQARRNYWGLLCLDSL
jgi:hypothetical protein